MGSMEYVAETGISRGCIARNPDTEFLRIISGTGQIAEAIRRSGLSKGEENLAFFLPVDGTGSPLSEEGVSTEIYNEHSDRAIHLIRSIGGGWYQQARTVTIRSR